MWDSPTTSTVRPGRSRFASPLFERALSVPLAVYRAEDEVAAEGDYDGFALHEFRPRDVEVIFDDVLGPSRSRYRRGMRPAEVTASSDIGGYTVSMVDAAVVPGAMMTRRTKCRPGSPAQSATPQSDPSRTAWACATGWPRLHDDGLWKRTNRAPGRPDELEAAIYCFKFYVPSRYVFDYILTTTVCVPTGSREITGALLRRHSAEVSLGTKGRRPPN